MNSKNFLKSSGSALLLGSSLVSIIGSGNVKASGIFGSIKNFFSKNKTENKEKKLSLKERKERYNRKIENIYNPVTALTLPLIVGFSFSAVSSLMAGMFGVTVDVSFEVAYKTAEAYMSKTFKMGMIVSTLIGVGLGAFNYIKKKKAEKDFKELKQLIGEGMLEKQWNLEDFQKMAKDDSESKKFLEQLLVLEPSSSENNEKNTPLLDKNKLNEKVEAFKELFAKEPETLKNVNDNYKKEIYKELINNLRDWCSGRKRRLQEPGKVKVMYFEAQKDIELASKIFLLKRVTLGEKSDYPGPLSLISENLHKNLTDESKLNFKKLLLHDIREYVSKDDASDDDIIKILKELTSPYTEKNRFFDFYENFYIKDGTPRSFYDATKIAYSDIYYEWALAEREDFKKFLKELKKGLKSFSEERKKEKNEGKLIKIYKKQRKILEGIEKFSYERYRSFKKTEISYSVGNDDLWFRATIATAILEKEYLDLINGSAELLRLVE